ncbi:LexA family transcriptional regulator [Vibrio sp. SCSIO 43137]|uniref:LexA family transcriptional regulator n=1 Tax=Vibrio sp. SCSIO 43137 TaxID=3021011 RepID=UPI002308216D|nr:XRE family transcriptional regulator [Vibrio sp. SCSIO 43137]WCE30117.1 XRE family transcriptional regulator [Vibrio sp. SCSIO 43137]
MSLIDKNKKTLKNFHLRLKEALGEHSYRAFSELSGVSATTLRDYVNEKSYPTLDRLAAISEASGKSLEWLATGELPDDNMVSVFQYDLHVSAGNGSYIESENPIAEFKFSKDWLRQQGLLGKKLSIVQVMGDSMEATLYDGDLILVRHDEARDGICVIRIDSDVLVKRVQYDYSDKSFQISSDNPRYKSFELSKDFDGDFRVIGQVVRVLQRVKQHDTV